MVASARATSPSRTDPRSSPHASRPGATSPSSAGAAAACYRSPPVHPPFPRPRTPDRTRTAFGSWTVAAALSVLLSAGGCIDATPYERPRPSPRAAPTARVATAPAHGFNDQIAWRHLDEGLAESKAQGRPLMLVVHASWCNRCKDLKPAFADQRLAELSERFVMVNADQDQTPAVLGYGPDGTYIPRVLFFDPTTGTLDADLQNPNRDRYHYYYSPKDDLPGMMEKALARYGKS